MPVVNPETGEPMSDDPDQENQSLAGGEGRGQSVSATEGPSEGSGVATGPDNAREAEPRQSDDGNAIDGSNASGGA